MFIEAVERILILQAESLQADLPQLYRQHLWTPEEISESIEQAEKAKSEKKSVETSNKKSITLDTGLAAL